MLAHPKRRRGENYILFSISKDKIGYNQNTGELNFTMDHLFGDNIYLMEKKSGNVYKLPFSIVYIAMYWYGIFAYECADDLIFNGTVNGNTDYYKLSVDDGMLNIKKMFNNDNVRGSVSLSDAYGNTLIEVSTNSNSTSYVMTSDGTLIESDHVFNIWRGFDIYRNQLFKAYDGFIYENGKKLDETGHFVDVESIPDRVILPKECLFYSEGNCDYYFSEPSMKYLWTNGDNVVKVTHTDTGDEISYIPLYTDATINDKNYIWNAVKCSNIICYISGNDVKRLNVSTNTLDTIVFENGVHVTKIKLCSPDQIEYYGYDNRLNDVHGMVGADGKISYEFTTPEIICYQIKPLNMEETAE